MKPKFVEQSVIEESYAAIERISKGLTAHILTII